MYFKRCHFSRRNGVTSRKQRTYSNQSKQAFFYQDHFNKLEHDTYEQFLFCPCYSENLLAKTQVT